MKLLTQLTLALTLGLLVTQHDALARGFGGFRGGGGFGGGFGGDGFDRGGGGFGGGGFDRGGGGFGGGGFDRGGGGFGGGGFDRGGGGFGGGGFGGGSFDRSGGGFGGGGFGGDAGGFRAGGVEGSAGRTQLNSFLGLPTDGGMHYAGGSVGARGAAVGSEGAAAGRAGASGHVYEGPMGTTVVHGAAGVQGAARGPDGMAAGGAFASGTAVKGPEGNVYAHGTVGARGVAAGPDGVAAGGAFASGAAARGPEGNVYAHGVAGARGFAAGPDGVAGGRAWATGTHYASATYYHGQALAGQRWYGANPVFSGAWTSAHPWAWHPAAYTAAAWTAAAWNAAAWPAVGDWLGWGDATPYTYDYGSQITYQDGNVYYGSQPAGSTTQYYQEAANLAGTGVSTPAADDAQWLPLGVFNLIPPDQKVPAYVVQLAVDKSGTLRGNCYAEATKQTVPITGAVDKKTQRVAFRIGDKPDPLVETGLYSLTQDEAPALVHSGPQKTSQYLLARVKQSSPAQ